MEKIIGAVNDALYGYVLIILLVAGGLWFTVRSKFVQFRMFKEQFKVLSEKPKDEKSVSSFQALMVSTASRVGTGNIVGVASALCLGGFGSVFWMWVIAIIGCASAFFESTLAQIFKKKTPEGCMGGPAYYIEGALKKRGLAIAFSVLLIVTYGVGFNMLASYNLQSTFSAYPLYKKYADYAPWVIGLIISALVCLCLFGGGSRIVKVTGVLVPVMGVAYVLIALVAIGLNVEMLPGIFKRIFTEAFDFKAIFGGFTGSCIMFGIKRGLFSNEAGVGSAPNASASADVSHPVKQGLVQMLSVFLDTVIICSATAFLCMCSGVEPSKALDGAPDVQESVKAIFGDFGPVFITVAMVLFAFTTLLGNLFYVDKGINHIIGHNPGKKTKITVNIVASLLILLGSGLSAGLLWGIADITMGAMTIINLPVVIILGKYVTGALKDYTSQRKTGRNPEFHSKNAGIDKELDYWK